MAVAEKAKFADVGILIRFDHPWQKKEIEAEAEKAGRSLNNYLIFEFSKRRKWRDRDPETGRKVPVE